MILWPLTIRGLRPKSPFCCFAACAFFMRPVAQASLAWAHKKSPDEIVRAFWSGRQDSNLRPPAPKAGAITGLRYAPWR